MQIKSMAIQGMDERGKGLALIARLTEVDSDGDTYERGAFSWKDGGDQWAMMVPAHNRRATPFGKARIYEESDIAYAELFLNLNTTAGKDWHQALLFDMSTGKPVQEWSFGYEAEYTYSVTSGSRVRVLSKVDVDELSPVLRGAGNRTGTIAIKGAKLREEKFTGLIADLGELAGAIDGDPSIVSASGLKQLREINEAISRVLAGDDGSVDPTKAAETVASDTALAHHLMFQDMLANDVARNEGRADAAREASNGRHDLFSAKCWPGAGRGSRPASSPTPWRLEAGHRRKGGGPEEHERGPGVGAHGALAFGELRSDKADLHVHAAALEQADPRRLERTGVAGARGVGVGLDDRKAPETFRTGLARAAPDVDAIDGAQQADALPVGRVHHMVGRDGATDRPDFRHRLEEGIRHRIGALGLRLNADRVLQTAQVRRGAVAN